MALDRHCAEALLAARLSRLVVCIDGATPETHERYRAGSRFDTVVGNVRQFLALRGRRRRPCVVMQTLMTRHNENEWSHLVELAHELGVDEFRPKTLSLGRRQRDLDALAREWLPSDKRLRRYEWHEERLVPRGAGKSCVWAERSGVVLCNGDVTTCCKDAHGQQAVGNVFGGGTNYAQLLASEQWREVRQRIRDQSLPLCRDCSREGCHPRKIRLRRAGRTWWRVLKDWWCRS
jgi:MoaA/NifB/PqqE/SkfB family radical SAM enzyme